MAEHERNDKEKNVAINTCKNLITFYSDATNEFTVKQENYLVKNQQILNH